MVIILKSLKQSRGRRAKAPEVVPDCKALCTDAELMTLLLVVVGVFATARNVCINGVYRQETKRVHHTDCRAREDSTFC